MKADANPKSFHTKATVERDVKRIEKSIAAYHQEMDEEDAQDEECAIGSMGADDPELIANVGALLEEHRKKKALQKQMLESGENQVSEVDTDARLLRKNSKTVGGYNCQIASDDKYKLIVVADVI